MKAKVVIKPYHALPCELEVFTINDVKANEFDFGDKGIAGDCKVDGCNCRFTSKDASQEILDKYHIDLENYQKICNMLEEALYVDGCGWCN